MNLSYFLASFLAFLLALYGTPLARAAALRFGVVDTPDGRLKNQTEPIPYFGGLAIYLAVLIPLCLFYELDKRILAILLSGTLVLLLGLIDDFGVLTPAAKFMGQIVAAFVLIKSGVIIHIDFLPLYINLALTVLWIIGMTNAMNIIDIMDGLCAGISLVASFCLFFVAALKKDTMIAIFALTLTGSLAGFLRYNFQPAKIYMGDAGSMFLGLCLGALAIIGDYSDVNRLALYNPILIFGVAIFDTVYVMILRLMQRKSPFLGSKDHFAIRLKIVGWPVRRIVIGSYVAASVLCILALINMFLPVTYSVVLYVVVAICFLGLGLMLSRIRVA
jgi:UDP-GlcNAc:undecaprenyl-phosphate/decaprenyl-phosphate GlcNAc-1-phosphate transferase